MLIPFQSILSLILLLLLMGLGLLGIVIYFPYILAALGIALLLLGGVAAGGFWWFRYRMRRIFKQAEQAFQTHQNSQTEAAASAPGPVIYVQAEEVSQQTESDS